MGISNLNHLEEYQSFLIIRESLSSTGNWADYNSIELPESLDIEYLAYSQMLDEHSREIANSINQLQRLVLSLKAWNIHLQYLVDDQRKFQIVSEFVEPIATVAINLPYVIRSRFIYSIAHLSHQANQSIFTEWKDDFPLDTAIYFGQADNFGSHWRTYNKLKRALEKIASGSYVDATFDFRNKYNHRYSPRIEVGLTGLVTRIVNKSGKVSYSFGHTEPLKLINIVTALEEQHKCCLKAFCQYQSLVKEQIISIQAYANKLPSD
jgi:hypothetical protein